MTDTTSSARSHLILTSLFVGLYALHLLVPRDFWIPDEARYGEVLREMLASGQWLILHLNGQPYPDKPVLYFWIVAALQMFVGRTAAAFHIVDILSTLAATAGVYLLASRMGSNRFSFRATAAFLTFTLTLIAGQVVRMDMMLTASVAFAIYALIKRLEGGGANWLVVFWAFVFLGIATKGPVTLLFTALPALIAAGWIGGWQGFRSLRPLLGLAGLAGLVAAWALPVWASGHGDYLRVIWSEQLLGRMVNAWIHKQPFYFYLLWAPLLFMPWTPLVVRGMYGLGRNRELWRSRTMKEKLMIAFIVIPFAAISMISGKLFIYLEPLAPMAAIVAAWQLEQIEDGDRVPEWIRWPPTVFLVLFGGVLAALVIHDTWPGGRGALLAGAGMVLLGGMAVVMMPARPGRWFTGWLWYSVLFSWLFLGLGTWALNPFFSPRALGEAVAAAADTGTEIGVVDMKRGILNYYAHRQFTELESKQVTEWRRQNPTGPLVFKDRDMERIFEGDVPVNCGINRVFHLNFEDLRLLGGCPINADANAVTAKACPGSGNSSDCYHDHDH